MRGDGRIFKHPKSPYWYVAYYGVKPDGSRGEFRESAKTKHEDEARRFLERRVKALRSHPVPRWPQAGDLGAVIAGLRKIAPEPLWILNAFSFGQLMGPIVYAWIAAGEILYVGRSFEGMVRPLRLSKHRGLAAAVAETDGGELRIWACEDRMEAVRLEASMIRRFKPPFNIALIDGPRMSKGLVKGAELARSWLRPVQPEPEDLGPDPE